MKIDLRVRNVIEGDVEYSFASTAIGDILLASTAKGLCALTFADNHEEALADLRRRFPKAELTECVTPAHRAALGVITLDEDAALTLDVCGTPFQLQVWQALLQVPGGHTITYGEIAKMINRPGAAQAVGNAVSGNPVAILIPCHRVLRADGCLGGYRWGVERKRALLDMERSSAE